MKTRDEFFKGQHLDKNQIAKDLASKKKKKIPLTGYRKMSHIKCD